jgi:D-sedoheptulose 7-phosphate isomerase
MVNTDFHKYAGAYIKTLGATLDKMDPQDIWNVVEALKRCAAVDGTVWLVGNGGSAALAAHMATDLQLGGLRAMSLTDVAALTTAANDNSYEYSFVTQLEMLARRDDVLIAISGSGKSPNIVRALEWATGNNLVTVGLVGFNGGAMKAHHTIHAPVDKMAQAQDVQQIVLHIIAYWLIDARKQAPR